MKTRWVYILGILAGAVVIGLLIILAIIFDYSAVLWWWGVAFPIIMMTLITGGIILIVKFRGTKSKKEKVSRKIDSKLAKKILDKILVYEYCEMIDEPLGETSGNYGEPDSEKTSLYHRWGHALRRKGEIVHCMISLKDPKRYNIVFAKREVIIDVNKVLENLAENPKIEESKEDVYMTDELGRPIRKTITKRVSQAQKKELEQKKREEEVEKL